MGLPKPGLKTVQERRREKKLPDNLLLEKQQFGSLLGHTLKSLRARRESQRSKGSSKLTGWEAVAAELP